MHSIPLKEQISYWESISIGDLTDFVRMMEGSQTFTPADLSVAKSILNRRRAESKESK